MLSFSITKAARPRPLTRINRGWYGCGLMVQRVDSTDGDIARAISAKVPGLAEDAETELYRRFAPRVRLYGLRHLRDEEAARDLMQQVLLLTIEKLRDGSVRDVDQIGSFILGVSRTMAIDLKRRDRRRERLRETFVVEPILEPHRELALDVDRLETCLGCLSERERIVVLLTFYAERSARQVGDEMRMTEGNVRVIRHRAIGKLSYVPEGIGRRAMTPPCNAPISDDDLLDYWTHAIEGADAERIEQHLFSCGGCAARLEAMASLGDGLRTLVKQGRVSGIVSRSLLNRMQRDGVHVRQYSLSPGERVPCAAFPDDDLVVISLRANFAGAETVTLSITGRDDELISRISDVPVSPTDSEILWAAPGEIIRRMPSTHVHLNLVSEAPGGETIAEYELDHTEMPPH